MGSSLTLILNTALELGIFPHEWKEARVSPVHKKSPRNDLNNCGPISVREVVAKIFEKIAFEQLYKYFVFSLAKYGMSPIAIKWFNHYLDERIQKCSVNGIFQVLIKYRPMHVPHGSNTLGHCCF